MSTSDIIQIVVGSITAIALLIATSSYWLSRRSYNKQYEYNLKLKSLEIADIMAVLISGDISTILEPFNSSDFKTFFDDYCSADLYSLPFDYSSLEERCKKNPLSKFGNAQSFTYKYLQLIVDYYYQKRLANGESPTNAKVNANSDFRKHSALFNLTLNKIEGISMYFCTDIADERIVYPSIHQVFLKLVKISSIRIANVNKSTLDEYYKYTIELYKLWNNRQSDYSKSDKVERDNKNSSMIKNNKFKR